MSTTPVMTQRTNPECDSSSIDNHILFGRRIIVGLFTVFSAFRPEKTFDTRAYYKQALFQSLQEFLPEKPLFQRDIQGSSSLLAQRLLDNTRQTDPQGHNLRLVEGTLIAGAAKSLVCKGNLNAFYVLVAFSRAQDPMLRKFAAEKVYDVLQKDQNPKAAQFILEQLSSDGDKNVKDAAEDFLQRFLAPATH